MAKKQLLPNTWLQNALFPSPPPVMSPQHGVQMLEGVSHCLRSCDCSAWAQRRGGGRSLAEPRGPRGSAVHCSCFSCLRSQWWLLSSFMVFVPRNLSAVFLRFLNRFSNPTPGTQSPFLLVTKSPTFLMS